MLRKPLIIALVASVGATLYAAAPAFAGRGEYPPRPQTRPGHLPAPLTESPGFKGLNNFLNDNGSLTKTDGTTPVFMKEPPKYDYPRRPKRP